MLNLSLSTNYQKIAFFNTMFEMFKSEAVTDKLSGSLKKRPDTWLFRKNQNVNFYMSNAGLR